MAYTQFKTVGPSDKPQQTSSGQEKDIRSRQIDELVKLSKDAKRDIYGPGWDDECRKFYHLVEGIGKRPSFRPKISAPQLQLLLLAEAADITDANIRVFINHKKNGRDKQREQAFQEHWKQEFFNLHLLMAQVYSRFCATSFLQVGYDPLAKHGRGNAWMRARLPENVHVDTNSPWPEDWTWQVIEDQMYLDQIKRAWPDHADKINPRKAKAENLAGPPAGGLEIPAGPMSITLRGLPAGESYTTDGLMTVRTAYALDTTVRKPTDLEEDEFKKRGLPVPEFLPKYPVGRMIVDAEGTILVDGDSWLPLGELWPAVPVWALPPWDTVWCPAPPKYTRSLQEAAEQQMTNTYENARRLNQGFLVVHETTGLNANSIGGLPGEIVVVAANSPPGQGVNIQYPPPFPPQMIQLPQMYLQLQKELRGHTPARQGNLSPGNVGPDLFEAAVMQSQSETRLSARLFAWSVQRVAELMFFTMAKGYTEDRSFFVKDEAIKWKADRAAEDYDMQLAEGSVRPLSQSALRQMVIELKKAGMMSVRTGLEMLDVPDADEIAREVENEMKLAALAKLQRK